MYRNILERFLSLRRVPIKIVVIAALASYALQLGAILQGFPLYLIAIYTTLPWIPLVFFESIWKIEHYTAIAIFAIVTALQVGHLGEHAAQVFQYDVLGGTAKQQCPPPTDTPERAQLGVEAGLRDPESAPTGIFANTIVQPNGSEEYTYDEDNVVTAPPSCGVIGAFDVETVHLVWDSLVWVGALWLLTRFPGNLWLWLSMIVASIHQVEHMFLGWIFFFENTEEFNFVRQLWATVADGNLITAYPVGSRMELANFYEAGGIIGIGGRGGLLESLLFGGPRFLPDRVHLHFGYNVLVIVPTVIAFLVQVRRVYDQYLAQALPELTEEQLIAATPKLEQAKYASGETVLRQGETADNFYILTKGQVEVIREQPDGSELVITRLGPGQYFGEIGLLHGGKRMATIRAASDVEVLSLDRMAFNELMSESEMSKDEMENVVRQRVAQVKAMQSAST